MKKIYLLAAAAALFAACSSSDDLAVKEEQPQVQSEPGAVGFDAYLQRATTRAGVTGDIDIAKLRGTADDYLPGFGVFAYYTNNNEYDPQSIPNFMYNQQVKWNGSYWTYDPIMYWPNEYGSNAISDDNDKVTFFAYAPYVAVVPSTGKIVATGEETKYGITGMSRNIANGDPLIKYLVSFDEDKKVDLCWGVCDDPQWNTINDGTQLINDTKGLPWLNVERPLLAAAKDVTPNQKVKFTFKHALAQLAVNVDAYVDGTDNTNIVDPKSRIYIRSITFTGFATKGTLNLNNEIANKAHWLDYNGTSDLESGEEVTIYDGRKDGKEGTAGGVATNEKVLGLNPLLIQDENQIDYTATPVAFIGDGDKLHEGVTKVAKNLFRSWDAINEKYTAATGPVYVIPTDEPVKVTIVYDVETPDPNLGVYLSDGKTPGSTIENRIEKEVNFGNTSYMQNGKKYTINLHLGMNSVKLDADVSEWETGATDQNVDLPSNIPSFATASTSYKFNVDATAGSVDVKLYGFNGGESITPAESANFLLATGIQADASGVVETTITKALNNSVKNRAEETISWTGAASGNQVILKIVQLAAPLNLTTTIENGNTEFTLSSSTSAVVDWDADIVNKENDIVIYRNGVKVPYSTSAAAGKFTFNTSDGKVILFTGEEAKTGDVFVITVKAGDAPTETITVKVGA